MLLRFVEFVNARQSLCLDSAADRKALIDAFAGEFALERTLIAAVVDAKRAPSLIGDNPGDISDAIYEIRLAYKGG